jgi:precorrin-2 dehydrogenase/sirohydrochlorin ferrochelatase
MKLFPAFFDLAGRACLVAGGGRVGLDRARALVAAGATVLVIDPAPSAELLAEAAAPGARLSLEPRSFRADDCRGRFLVFACTGTAEVDGAVAAAATAAGALCCRADGVAADFTTGAVLRRGDLCVAVSSGGASPALAADARDRAAEAIGEEYGEAAVLLGALRRELGAGERSAVVGRGLVRDVLAALRSGDAAGAEALVEEALATVRRRAASRETPCTH